MYIECISISMSAYNSHNIQNESSMFHIFNIILIILGYYFLILIYTNFVVVKYISFNSNVDY